MHVLGLTNMRTTKLERPFEALDGQGSLVTVEESSIRAYAAALWRGARHVRREDSDAVLVYHGAGLLGLVGVVLSRYSGVPLVLRLIGDTHRQHRDRVRRHWRGRRFGALAVHLLFMLATELTYRSAAGYLPVSAALVDPVRRETGAPPERVVPVPNTVGVDEYDIRDRRPDREDSHLVTVTNLDYGGKYQGTCDLADAVVPVLERHPNARWTIAGDGHYRGRLERALDRRVTDRDVRDRIHVPGFVDDVADLYAEADVFVYVSYIDGYPNVIMEAQAAGLPVVANPAYGIVEQVADGESGLLVNPDEPATVAETISSLLDDADERNRLGRNGRRRVERENAPAVVGRELLDAIRGLPAVADGDSGR